MSDRLTMKQLDEAFDAIPDPVAAAPGKLHVGVYLVGGEFFVIAKVDGVEVMRDRAASIAAGRQRMEEMLAYARTHMGLGEVRLSGGPEHN